MQLEVEALKGEVAASSRQTYRPRWKSSFQAPTNQAMGRTLRPLYRYAHSAFVQGEAQKTSLRDGEREHQLAASVEKIRTNLAIDEFRLKHEITPDSTSWTP